MVRTLGLVGLRDALYTDRRSLLKEPSNVKYKFGEKNVLKRQLKFSSFPQVTYPMKYFESKGFYVESQNQIGALKTII